MASITDDPAVKYCFLEKINKYKATTTTTQTNHKRGKRLNTEGIDSLPRMHAVTVIDNNPFKMQSPISTVTIVTRIKMAGFLLLLLVVFFFFFSVITLFFIL